MMSNFNRKNILPRFIAALVLCCILIIFVHSELIVSDDHHDHDGSNDFCNLVSHTLNRFQNEIQDFDFEVNQQPVFEVKIDLDYNLFFLPIPEGFRQRTIPLILLLNTFLI